MTDATESSEAAPSRLTNLLRGARLTGAGLLASLSLGPWGWWPLAVVGLAVLHVELQSIAQWRRRLSTAWTFLLGYHLLALVWMVDLTPPGFVVSMPILSLIMAAPLAVPTRREAAPIAIPAALMLGDAWTWVIPFGGVPMGNLALGQVNGPLLVVARAGGPLAVVLCVGLLAAALGEAVTAGRRRELPGPTALGPAGLVLLAIAAGVTAPAGTAVGNQLVSSVQGGGRLGTNAVNSDLGSVYERHLEATAAVPDGAFVVWPESAVTVDDDFDGSREQLELSTLAAERQLTFLVGVTQRRDDTADNLAVVIGPDGRVVDEYSKVHLVPFGEYIPLRSLVDPFADLSLIPREFIAGEGDGVLDTPIGPVAVGISFEVYFTERIRSGVNAGGAFVVNPTLASSYRTTHVPEQSLASARLRAVETGRWVVQSSTTGYSAIVDPDGQVVGRTGLREQAVVTETIELREGDTWAVRTGKAPITTLMLLVLIVSLDSPRQRASGTATALISRVRRRRR